MKLDIEVIILFFFSELDCGWFIQLVQLLHSYACHLLALSHGLVDEPRAPSFDCLAVDSFPEVLLILQRGLMDLLPEPLLVFSIIISTFVFALHLLVSISWGGHSLHACSCRSFTLQ